MVATWCPAYATYLCGVIGGSELLWDLMIKGELADVVNEQAHLQYE